MGRINKANLKKTIYYLKRNGIRRTWHAVLERLEERRQPPYAWIPPTDARLAAQRRGWEAEGLSASFSIIVPVYRTKAAYLEDLVESLRCQTYPKWELILADATEDDSVERALGDILSSGEAATGGFSDSSIRYVRLERNLGIAGNTDQAIPHAAGDYIGLMDHDDVLTPDALYEMAAAVRQAQEKGTSPAFLYSDEDKCNGDRTEYFEPNRKESFNLDLLLSNNYICHFLVMKRELMQELGFRQEYDGAQDFDLVLRAAASLKGREQGIVHVPKVLYHWRCHPGSTAENPESKRYAYEAGRRAVQDFADRMGWRARAVDTAHVGFYALRYQGGVFASRADVGAIGGRVAGRGGRTCGGRMTRDGQVLYGGLRAGYSGYLHRAALAQDAEAVDLRNIRVRPECQELFRRVTGIPYRTVPGTDRFDASGLGEDMDIVDLSLQFCQALRKEGYRILYLPEPAQEARKMRKAQRP